MTTANAVLEQFLEPVRQALSIEQARRLAEFHADPSTQTRVDELTGKCNEGTLTEEERAEYEAFVEAGDFIAILQAEARQVLADMER